MLKKIAFGVILVICLYTSFSLISELSSEKYDIEATAYFNKNDSTVYVIHETRGIDFQSETFKTLPTNLEIIQSIKESIPDDCSVYFSKNRALLVFESKSNWSKSSIKELFIDGKHKIIFTDLREFKYGFFEGVYSKNKILLYSGPKPHSFNTTFSMDKKANYSIVSLENKKNSVRDYYVTSEKTLCYNKIKKEQRPLTNKLDRQIFSSFIPQNFDDYTFYEKEYLATIDTVYKNSTLYEKTLSGVLLLKKDNRSLIIIDLKRGQNLVESGASISNIEVNTMNYVKQKVSYFADDKEAGAITHYFVSDINDFAILSKDKSYFDQNLTEIKLGNVLIGNKKKLDVLYQNGPRKVIFREINSNSSKTISVAGTDLIETNIAYKKSINEDKEESSKDYFAMNTEERIASFYAYAGRGNTFLVTDSNTWIRFENGNRKWEKTFNKKVLKQPKLMEMSSNQYQDIAILFKDTLLIVDKEGRILNHFRTSGAVHPIRCRIKNKVAFLIPNTDRMEVVDYDGKVLATYSFSSDIKDMVLFNEKGKKHVAVLCKEMFFIINLDRKRTVRKIKLSDNYKLIKQSEKSVIMNASESRFINLLGNEMNCAVPQGYQYKCAFKSNGLMHMIFAKENHMMSINENGKYEWKRVITCSSIDKIVVHKSQNNSGTHSIILGLLDGIENKILLLNTQGSKMDDVKRHGEKDLQITDYGNRGISITTFLGNYLIQYAKF